MRRLPPGMAKSSTVALLVCLLFVAVMASAAQEGRTIFVASCAGCHGLDGRGGERAPDIATRRSTQRLSDQALRKIVEDGVSATGMPSFRSLGQAKITAVLQYLRTLQGAGIAVSLPGNPVAGKSLFFGKAGCSECHMADGAGGFLGSDLSNYASNQSAKDIRNAIIAPGKISGQKTSAVVVTTLQGQRLTGIVRNEDNFSIQLQAMDGSFHLLSKSDLKSVERQQQPLMPTDYGSRLTSGELDDLVSYLLKIAQDKSTPTRSVKKSKPRRFDD